MIAHKILLNHFSTKYDLTIIVYLVSGNCKTNCINIKLNAINDTYLNDKNVSHFFESIKPTSNYLRKPLE